MSTLTNTAEKPVSLHRFAWLPVVLLPLAVFALAGQWPVWFTAWVLAAAVYAGFKWLTFAESEAARNASFADALNYLFLWPGMDADAFLGNEPAVKPTRREVVLALLKTAAGLTLLFGVARFTTSLPLLVTGWVGIVGIALTLLFGVAHLLSIAWRLLGVNAQPIMNRPLWATSLSDFWGQRWNLAFHDVGREFVFRPLLRRVGVIWSTLAVFLFSGVVHDLVMSVPLRQGIGLPTIYFLLQGCAVLFERSRVGKRLGLSRGLIGRAFTAAIVLLPIGLLFHFAFLQQVILPTLEFIGAIG
ncbi:MBOAT family protein [Anatilimnocola aggregata]|uniref:MBOAT family protein n=1 Tax=Anatilimnocola aggregata TaxID=2528021 RepID=A0A517YNX4_9BACT|nr:MBOAT family protein [Anatilimnocola aggregata]QDU31928.1 MBOAT family protein [Anatilimnocola aggregata]